LREVGEKTKRPRDRGRWRKRAQESCVLSSGQREPPGRAALHHTHELPVLGLPHI
jgi:hypothetical protein